MNRHLYPRQLLNRASPLPPISRSPIRPPSTRVYDASSPHHSEIMTSGWCGEVGWMRRRSHPAPPSPIPADQITWVRGPARRGSVAAPREPRLRRASVEAEATAPRPWSSLTGHRWWRGINSRSRGEASGLNTPCGLPAPGTGASPAADHRGNRLPQTPRPMAVGRRRSPSPNLANKTRMMLTVCAHHTR